MAKINILKLDSLGRHQGMTEKEIIRQAMAKEASILMKRNRLILDKKRMFDRWIIQIRRESNMFPVWTKRGMDEDVILTEMLEFLREYKD